MQLVELRMSARRANEILSIRARVGIESELNATTRRLLALIESEVSRHGVCLSLSLSLSRSACLRLALDIARAQLSLAPLVPCRPTCAHTNTSRSVSL